MSLPVCKDTGHRCLKGQKYLHKEYHDVPCQSVENERRQIGELLDSWMDRIEVDCGLKTANPDPCAACYPEYSCFGSFSNPLCRPKLREPLITNIPLYERRLVSEKRRVADMDDRVKIVYVEDSVKHTPVWERPRVRSQRLVGSQYRKLADCFKHNGLTYQDCPRTPSCKLARSLQEVVELDKKYNKLEKEMIECCCCPGIKSSLPNVKCITCPPPDPNIGRQVH